VTYISLRCRGGILQKSRGRGIRHTCSFYSKCKQDCIETMMVLADPKSTFNPHPHLHTYIRTHAHLILLYTQRCAPLLLLHTRTLLCPPPPVTHTHIAMPPSSCYTHAHCYAPLLLLQTPTTLCPPPPVIHTQFCAHKRIGKSSAAAYTRASQRLEHLPAACVETAGA